MPTFYGIDYSSNLYMIYSCCSSSVSSNSVIFYCHNYKDSFAGTCRWGEFGEGGLLWGECNSRQFEWFEGNPVNELLFKVAA